MQNCKINTNGTLEISPSVKSSKHDFDFYEGKWNIKNKRLNERLSNCTEWTEFEAYQEMKIILQGTGNTDDFLTEFEGKPFEGRTIRLFNPQTKLWSMYWTDSESGVLQPPTVGSFENGIGKFYCKDIFKDQKIIVEFLWDKTNVDNPIWSQAFSIDEGRTWEVNWYMYMSKNLGT